MPHEHSLEKIQFDFLNRILKNRNPVTGLIPQDNHKFWVRDNLYIIHAAFALSQAFKKRHQIQRFQKDLKSFYNLKNICSQAMRSIFTAFLLQRDKLELRKQLGRSKNKTGDFFHSKEYLENRSSLHVKFDFQDLKPVEDDNYSHLQLDVVALFLLTLAQLTKSGFEIIQSQDEVAMIQNLIFYIERAYRTPDYGIWERGSKTNQNEKEINASSVGMCLAALEACADLKLVNSMFSLHVIPDDISRCRLTLNAMLPKESYSKEVDSSILFTLGYPGFVKLNNKTRNLTIKKISKYLRGHYGFKRFLRDGYKTPVEDINRLYYNETELKIFDGVECQWPMFNYIWKMQSYFYDDNYFDQITGVDSRQLGTESEIREREKFGVIVDYPTSLEEESTMKYEFFDESSNNNNYNKKPNKSTNIHCLDFFPNLPMLYSVRPENASSERRNPNFTARDKFFPNNNNLHYFGEGLRTIYRLLKNHHIGPSDLDPIDRHITAKYAPNEIINSTIVQIVMFTEDEKIAAKFGIPLKQEIEEKNDVAICSGSMLSNVFCGQIGKSECLDLSGRQKRKTIGALSSCTIYRSSRSTEIMSDLAGLDDSQRTFYGFIGRLFDRDNAFYFFQDPNIVFDMIIREINYIASSWSDCNFMARPVFFFPVCSQLVAHANFYSLLSKINSGYLEGARVFSPALHTNFVEMSAISILPFDVEDFLEVGGRIRRESYLDENQELQSYYKNLTSPENSNNKDWHEIRTTAAKLNFQASGLVAAVDHLLLLQKQITIGLGSQETVILKPLFAEDLNQMIIEKCSEPNIALRVVTQEIIIFLAQFCREKTKIYADFLRLRINVIIKVIAQELSRKMVENETSDNNITTNYNQALSNLTKLSPSGLQTLLKLIMTSQDFFVENLNNNKNAENATTNFNQTFINQTLAADEIQKIKNQMKNVSSNSKMMINKGRRKSEGHEGLNSVLSSNKSFSKNNKSDIDRSDTTMTNLSNTVTEIQSTGPNFEWLRRRRLDGALNRTPPNFYYNVWCLLEKCHGISINKNFISHAITQQCTPNEIQFSLIIENCLNSIKSPEYRQMIVEVIVLFCSIALTSKISWIGDSENHNNFDMDKILNKSEKIFCEDQLTLGADDQFLQKCSSILREDNVEMSYQFMDSAPSGKYGTLTYIARAIADVLG